MVVDDLIIEVRDPSLARVGQFRPHDLVGAKFILRFNNVGGWEMRLPYAHHLGELLRLPGYGLIVTGPDGNVILSGPTISAKLEQTSQDPEGFWTITGADDSLYLLERLAYPNPTTDDVTDLGQAYDARLGSAESVLKEYLSYNIGPNAVASRKIDVLAVETNYNRGEIVQGNARFDVMQNLFYGLAQTGGIGYHIVQVDDYLEFRCYEPTDRSAYIRLDLENQKLSKAEYAYANAKATRVIVGGQGEAEYRRFVEVTTTDSEAAEAEWGRRIETFKDGRNSRVTDFLIQDGLEALVDTGKTIKEFSVTPSDDVNMRFGYDWGLGDTVTVVSKDLEGSAVVTEIGIAIESDGVRIGATVGTPTGVTYEEKILAKTQQIDQRVNNLEKSVTGYGINIAYQPSGGTTGGTQPSFDPAGITGSFNRFGNMMHFNVQVDFTYVTDFGTGHYYVTLPEIPLNKFTLVQGELFDASQNKSYLISGVGNQSNNRLDLYYLGSSGQLEQFTSSSPKALSTDDYFDISGTYEIEG